MYCLLFDPQDGDTGLYKTGFVLGALSCSLNHFLLHSIKHYVSTLHWGLFSIGKLGLDVIGAILFSTNKTAVSGVSEHSGYNHSDRDHRPLLHF